jgi:hypothetical protein
MADNEGTKLQIRTFLENAIKNAQNPSPKEKMRRLRKEKMKKVEKLYGF